MDWDGIDLVVFDVDGTLYDQRHLRARMAMSLLRHTVQSGSLRLPMVLRAFRQCRETLGKLPAADFLERQYELTAMRCGCSAEDVRALAEEWIERRPLAHIGVCRYPGIRPLFEALALSKRTIAIFSDYPAAAKLDALGLRADLIVSATDEDVRRLKPHPAGLKKILALTGTDAGRAVMIGDRADRDGAAARRAGMHALIRGRRADAGRGVFRTYSEELFQPVLREGGRRPLSPMPDGRNPLVTKAG